MEDKEQNRPFLIEWLTMWSGYNRGHFEKMDDAQLLEAYRRGMMEQARRMEQGRGL